MTTTVTLVATVSPSLTLPGQSLCSRFLRFLNPKG